jgi:hypothetical protein
MKKRFSGTAVLFAVFFALIGMSFIFVTDQPWIGGGFLLLAVSYLAFFQVRKDSRSK